MLSRISSSAENCGHSSGDAGGIPVSIIVCSGATSVGSASARLQTMPSQTTRENQWAAMSERLQILDDCGLVCRGQHRPVFMTAVAIARNGRVVLKEHATFLLRHVRHEADACLVKDVV